MTKTHLIKDESLGGVLREYIEVDRKAKIGDKIAITVPQDGFPGDSIMKVVYVFENGHVNAWHEKTVTTNFIANGEFAVLEPTDIIRIDTKRYRMVDRKANVGDKVIITEGHPTLVYKDVGEIVEILETYSDTFDGMIKPHDFGEKGAVYHFQYRVLEPIESPNSKTDDTSANIMYYRMVDRKANVGDEIIVTDSPIVKSGTIGTCIANSSGYDGLITIDVHSYEDMYALINADTDKYHVLELIDPLNDSVGVINIDGEYYRLVDRKANVGDKVFSDGIIREVEGRLDPINGIEFECYVDEDGDNVDGWLDGYYMVLEPVDSQPTDQLDIIARLTRKVAQLERENTDIKRDLETWAQDVERLKRKLDDDRRDIEMVIDDIVTLDERTQPEELAKKLAEVITKGLNAIDPRHFG
ncbi:MAG: hypothetical protein IRZ03_10725 [Acidobacterium ailaaui]|nr:hypothetical protein [Pseudacidobacterium ailaaui]